MANSGRTYRLYRGWQGEPRNHWQYMGEPTVPGAYRDLDGHLHRPPPHWIVLARSAREACLFAHESTTSQSRDDDFGIWWDAGDEWED